tara:strand:- start:374 stop:613 length:240 start_codon:yes stop_codon:yes gene_type:complete
MDTKLERLEKNKQRALYNYETHTAATQSAIAELCYCREEQAKSFEALMGATKKLDSGINEERDKFYFNHPESIPDSIGG